MSSVILVKESAANLEMRTVAELDKLLMRSQSLSYAYSGLLLPHVYDTSDTISCLHVMESLVDIRQRLAVGDKLIHLQLPLQIVIYERGQL